MKIENLQEKIVLVIVTINTLINKDNKQKEFVNIKILIKKIIFGKIGLEEYVKNLMINKNYQKFIKLKI